jgi:hypothetical protein
VESTAAFFIADLGHLTRDVEKDFTRPSFQETEGIVTF